MMKCGSWKRWVSRAGVMMMVAALGGCGDGGDGTTVVIPSINFGTPVNLSNNAGASVLPAVVISGSTVLVAWDDATPGNGETFVAHSTDGGISFGTPVNLSNNAGDSFAPAMAISGSTVLVAWEDETPGNSEILLARSQ